MKEGGRTCGRARIRTCSEGCAGQHARRETRQGSPTCRTADVADTHERRSKEQIEARENGSGQSERSEAFALVETREFDWI